MPIVRANGIAIHYWIDGETGSPLVLSNSLGAALEMWEPQLESLARRHRVIRYDTRGHGKSDAPPGPYSIALLAADALALLDALSIARTHFCGLSMGGMIGIRLAIDAPRRIDRLVLANTAAKIGTAEQWNARIAAVEEGGTVAVAPAVLARWLPQALLAEPTPIVRRLRETFERTSTPGYVGCCAAVRDFDARGELRHIRASTLVIVGSEDLSTPPSEGRDLADAIAGARCVELPAAHLSNIQAAAAFTRALEDFLPATPAAP